MAHSSTANRTVSHGFLDRFVPHFATLRDALERYKVYRQTLNELRTLGPRELNDLGLNKTMLTQIAYEAAYGK